MKLAFAKSQKIELCCIARFSVSVLNCQVKTDIDINVVDYLVKCMRININYPLGLFLLKRVRHMFY